MADRGTLLTVAGYDPGSGAGITADLQVFAAHGCFGTSAITALTVQSTQGVRAVQPVASDWLRATLQCLQDDLPPVGIKVGMLATASNVYAVADYVTGLPRGIPVVLDPVMVSSSGSELLSEDGVDALRTRLLPLVAVVTPNRAELARLTGETVDSRADMERVGRGLAAAHPDLSVVVTGGDLDACHDCVVLPGGQISWLPGVRIASDATHGTGCAFSSALLCNMVAGRPGTFLEQARAAKEYVRLAIARAEPRGRGKGPMNLRRFAGGKDG